MIYLEDIRGWKMSIFNSKIIIENSTDLSDLEATKLVYSVLHLGKVSGENQYCWCTTYTHLGSKYVVLARKNKGSTHSFVVCNEDNC